MVKHFPDDLVEPFARAWASIDGNAQDFDREKGLPVSAVFDEGEDFTGHYLGYMEEARELLRRAGVRQIEGNGKRLKL